MATPEWWKPGTDVLQATSAIVVAAFGAIQVWRERRRVADQERSTETRVSASAFLIRRTVFSWFDGDLENADALEQWLRAAQNAGTLTAQLHEVERQAADLIGSSADAPRTLATSLQRAYVYLLSGTSRVATYAASGRPSGDTLFEQLQMRTDAIADLRDAMAAFAAGPMHRDLLRLHADVQAKRRAEDPFRQLAGALSKQFGGRP